MWLFLFQPLLGTPWRWEWREAQWLTITCLGSGLEHHQREEKHKLGQRTPHCKSIPDLQKRSRFAGFSMKITVLGTDSVF